MNWSRCWLALVIFLLLVSCRGQEPEAHPTPTPFSEIGVTLRAPVGEPIAISLSNLASNPALFEGANLLLSGEYKPLPQMICQQDAFPSPATWALLSEGLQANATGLDSQLRQLVDTGQTITVEGRWLRYNGPVGCGKDAPEQEVWYLSTSRVVEPNPLERGGQVVQAPTAALESTTAAPTEPALEETTETPTITPTVTVTAPSPSPSPTYVPSPTLPAGEGQPQRNTATPVPSPVTGTAEATSTGAAPGTGTPTLTPTVTVTGTPATATPTTQGGTTTPTLSATTPAGVTIDKGRIEPEDLVMSRLESGQIDSRSFSVSSSTSLTITVAPAGNADLVLTVRDPNGQIIADARNQTGPGEVETITDLGAPEIGAYRIEISSNPAETTDYAMMVLKSDSYSFIFKGTLDYGEQRGDTLEANNDHFWFFNADDGDSINLLVTPNGEEDPYVELYGPDGSLLDTIDETGAGEAEELTDRSILASGMYSIRVGEFDFQPMGYLLVVDSN